MELPQPRKSMLRVWIWGFREDTMGVNVREEPPQKWRKMRDGFEDGVPDERTLRVVDGLILYWIDCSMATEDIERIQAQ